MPANDRNFPRLSIIIPSFNQANYLETAIQSVLAQNYSNLELIIVDGGSTDNSRDIIHKYASTFAWCVSEPDRGQSHAINKGFERCTGEIITFLSSDDYYLPGTLLDVASLYLQNQNSGAIVGGFCFLEPNHAKPDDPIIPYMDGLTPTDLTLGPPGRYRLHQVSTFYTRHALDAVGRWVREDMRYVMDRELLYRVVQNFPITLTDDPYGVFRGHKESKSTAEILPFAREFARLYEINLSGEPEKDRQRRHMARYRLARGYMKMANVGRTRIARLGRMLQAAFATPEFVFGMEYFRRWAGLVWGKRLSS
jgi:glycosyltransferase involved in cell wall biosynthesis